MKSRLMRLITGAAILSLALLAGCATPEPIDLTKPKKEKEKDPMRGYTPRVEQPMDKFYFEKR